MNVNTQTDPRELWRTIPGWCAFAESYRKAVRDARDPALFVEVGSWLGKSAALMASLIQASGKGIEFCCIDPWQDGGPDLRGTTYFQSLKVDDVYSIFLGNVKPFAGLVKPMRGFSTDVAKDFGDETIDYIMLDGDHSYQAVRADIDAWLPKMKPGSVMAGDDYLWPGVKQAVDEKFGRRVVQYIKSAHRDYKMSVAYWEVQL